jgi:hypothetical protein
LRLCGFARDPLPTKNHHLLAEVVASLLKR